MMSMLAVALAASPALWVSFHPGAAASGPCQLESFLSAINSLRPALAVRAGSEPAEGDAAAAIDVENGEWRLTVQRRGQEALRRTLPAPGSDCVATAGTAALMLDRALDELHWSGAPVQVEALPEAATPDAPREFSQAPGSVREGRLALGAGAATVFGVLKPAAALELEAQQDLWSLGLGALATPSVKEPIGGSASVGAYSVSALDLQLFLGRRFSAGPGAFLFELAPGVELARGSTSGALFQQHPGTTAAFLLGARAAYEVSLPARFSVSLRAEGRAFPSAISFNVQGEPGDFSSSHFAANLLACASRNFF